MKFTTKLLILLTFVSIMPLANAQDSKLSLKTQKDSLGYVLGSSYANQLKSYNVTDFIGADGLLQGLKDALFNNPSAFTQEEAEKLMKTLDSTIQADQRKKQEAQEAEMLKQAEPNIAEGKKFLEDNGKRKGVTTTTTGLQYETITPGTGKQPKSTDKVKVHYTGTLINGTKFDSSVDRGEPIEFRLDQVIPGWTEGLQLMKEGGKTKLYVPSNLGYGNRAAGQIPPGSVLIFEVELIQVVTE